MKKVRKNVLKVLVMLLAVVFVSQGLCFSAGQAVADTLLVNASAPYVSTLADSDETEIKTASDLVKWLKNPTGNVRLVGGAGTVFDLGNADTYSTKAYSGRFDGGYVALKNVAKPLFSTLNGSAEVKNVYIESGSISLNGTNSIGSIALYAKGSAKISNCLNKASVSLTSTYESAYAGGIVGYAESNATIELCSNHANVTVDNNKSSGKNYAYAGGIVGYVNGTTARTVTEPKTVVSNCYVSSISNSNISITAEARAVNDTSSTTVSKGTTKYYNGLSHLVTKVNEDFEKIKNQIAGKNNEESTLRKTINNLKSQINSLESQINSLESKINNVRRKQNNLKWYEAYMWPIYEAEIIGYRAAQGALRVSQGALWTSVGAVEASIVVVRGAISALQATLSGLSAIVTYNLNDVSWIAFYDNAKYQLKHEDAYAYGIGYMNGANAKITDCYTDKVSTSGGEYTTTYTFYLRFWSKSEFLRGNYMSDKFTRTLTFKAENNYGPISNANVTDGYYFATADKDYNLNRHIYIDGNTNNDFNNATKVDEKKYSCHVQLEKQQLFFRNTGGEKIDMLVANGHTFLDDIMEGYAGIGTLVLTREFDTKIQNLVLLGNENTKDYKTHSKTATDAMKKFDSSVWGVSSSINGGKPYLKCRYWQEV